MFRGRGMGGGVYGKPLIVGSCHAFEVDVGFLYSTDIVLVSF